MPHDGFWNARTPSFAGAHWASLAKDLRKNLGYELTDNDSPWYPSYKEDWLGFQREVLGVKHPKSGKLQHWEFQRHATQALYKHRRVAITSSRSTGKTKWLGDIIPTFLYTEPSRVIIIGPTMRQIVKGVMSECRKAMESATTKFFTQSGATSQTEIRIDERHWALCLPARNPDALRGFHASPQIPSDPDEDNLSAEDLSWFEEQVDQDETRMLIVVDEAAHVSAEAYRVLRGIMTKPNVYVALTGNPMLGVDDDHEYVRAFRPASRFHRIRVSSIPVEEAPTPEGIEYDKVFDHVPNYLVAPEEIESARKEFSDTDPIFVSDWCGTFSTGSSDWRVVPRTALLAAVASGGRNLQPLGPRIGVDIGTGSPDMSVASLFFDGVKLADHSFAPDADDVAGQVTIADIIMQLSVEWGRDLGSLIKQSKFPFRSSWDGSPIPGHRVSIDDSGLVGVSSILGARNFLVDRVNFAKSAEGQWRSLTGVQRSFNIRTEMHWVMRRGLQEGVFIIPPEFTRSWEEAGWTEFRRDFDSIGPLVRLQKKDDVIKRYGRSPDTFDADLLAVRKPSESPVVAVGAPALAPSPKLRKEIIEQNVKKLAKMRARGASLLPGSRKIQ